MRVLMIAAVSVVVAGAALAAANPGGKPAAPKPLDIRKTVNDMCGGAPYGLVELNGKTASKQELEEAKFQVTSFITQADVYQDCLIKLAEKHDKVLTPADIRFMQNAMKISQDEKEAVGNAFNNAVCEYNAANKIPDADCKDGKWVVKTVEQASSSKPKPAVAKPATAPKPATKTTTPAATTAPKTP